MDGRKQNKELNQAIRRIQAKLEKDPENFKISKKDKDLLHKELDKLEGEDFKEDLEIPDKVEVKLTKRKFSKAELEMLEEIRKKQSIWTKIKNKLSEFFRD